MENGVENAKPDGVVAKAHVHLYIPIGVNVMPTRLRRVWRVCIYSVSCIHTRHLPNYSIRVWAIPEQLPRLPNFFYYFGLVVRRNKRWDSNFLVPNVRELLAGGELEWNLVPARPFLRGVSFVQRRCISKAFYRQPMCSVHKHNILRDNRKLYGVSLSTCHC